MHAGRGPRAGLERHGVSDGGDGGHLEKAGEGFFAGAGRIAAFEDGLGQLEGDGRSAERFFRIRAAGLVGVEDGQRMGHGVVGLGEVMVGDDEVEAQLLRGFSFGEGPHAGIDRDDQANTFSVGRFKDVGLQSVALAKTVGHMKASLAAEHLDGGFEQDNGSGAVHVVVAVEQHWLMGGDGPFEPLDGCGHT
jgi:hypothetical protein